MARHFKAFFDNVEPTTPAILFDFSHDLAEKPATPAFAGASFFGIMR
jgi:hypothetical protein